MVGISMGHHLHLNLNYHTTGAMRKIEMKKMMMTTTMTTNKNKDPKPDCMISFRTMKRKRITTMKTTTTRQIRSRTVPWVCPGKALTHGHAKC